MATQKLYLYEANNEIQRLGNSMSTSYKFDGQELTVYWKGRKQVVKASMGDAFVVGCYGGMPEVSKLKLPKSNHRLLMWLCGFYSHNSATDSNKFQEILEENREGFNWWNYQEYGPKTDDYSFVLCNRSDCGGEHHVAAYINGNLPLTTEKVIEILNAYYQVRWSYMPIQFVREVLRKRFHMNDLDFEKIHFDE